MHDFLKVTELDIDVFGGNPIALDDAHIIGFRYIPRPDNLEDFDEVYLCRVTGNSLIDERIASGDWIAFKVTTDAQPGDLAVIATPAGLTVKFLFIDSDGNVTLQAACRGVKAAHWMVDDIQVRGVVVASGRFWGE